MAIFNPAISANILQHSVCQTVQKEYPEARHESLLRKMCWVVYEGAPPKTLFLNDLLPADCRHEIWVCPQCEDYLYHTYLFHFSWIQQCPLHHCPLEQSTEAVHNENERRTGFYGRTKGKSSDYIDTAVFEKIYTDIFCSSLVDKKIILTGYSYTHIQPVNVAHEHFPQYAYYANQGIENTLKLINLPPIRIESKQYELTEVDQPSEFDAADYLMRFKRKVQPLIDQDVGKCIELKLGEYYEDEHEFKSIQQERVEIDDLTNICPRCYAFSIWKALLNESRDNPPHKWRVTQSIIGLFKKELLFFDNIFTHLLIDGHYYLLSEELVNEIYALQLQWKYMYIHKLVFYASQSYSRYRHRRLSMEEKTGAWQDTYQVIQKDKYLISTYYNNFLFSVDKDHVNLIKASNGMDYFDHFSSLDKTINRCNQ